MKRSTLQGIVVKQINTTSPQDIINITGAGELQYIQFEGEGASHLILWVEIDGHQISEVEAEGAGPWWMINPRLGFVEDKTPWMNAPFSTSLRVFAKNSTGVGKCHISLIYGIEE
jgi:hypothetical protein